MGFYHRVGSRLRPDATRLRCAAASMPVKSPGPKILFAGNIFPKGGHPVYLPPELQLPEAATPEEAAQMARVISEWASTA